MIIKGKAVFKCPKTGEEVKLHKRCTNIDGKGNNCPHYKHWSWEGARPLLVCTFAQKIDVVEEMHRMEAEEELHGTAYEREPAAVLPLGAKQ